VDCFKCRVAKPRRNVNKIGLENKKLEIQVFGPTVHFSNAIGRINTNSTLLTAQ
jgi:hypothetical protein